MRLPAPIPALIPVLLVSIVSLASAPPSLAVGMPVPIDVNAMAKSGAAKITATKFDINDASKIFDDDRDSLARTESINPAVVQVDFTEPQTIIGVRVRFTSERHDWTLTTGDEQPDVVRAQKTFQGDDPQTVMFSHPVTARAFRLDVKRLEGDNYVHILDWELLQPGEVTSLSIARKDARNQPDSEITENSVLTFTASAKTADGRTLDVTKDASWSSPTPGVKEWRAKNQFYATQPGDATITASLGGISISATVPVKGYDAKNNDFDLDAMYVERTPRINYDSNKETGGWPHPGQRVNWIAHLHNWGPRDVTNVSYRWVLDGKPVLDGVIRNWKADTDTTVTFPWRWEQARHTLTFILDADSAFPDEMTKANNQVTVDTDALAVGYWVEDGLWRWMHEHQRELGDGLNSFEDWGQRQMGLWNAMFARAKYGTSPDGITDRVRLDQVVRVPTGALPLNGGIPTNNPDVTDKTVDLMWGMTAQDMGPNKFWDVKLSGPFYYEYGLIHELDHARYLIDSYGFDVHRVAVEKLTLPDGSPMAGTPAMPFKGDVVRYDKYRGMMDSTHYFSEYEAYEWNRIAGKRARKGNQNGPDDIGAFLNEDLPQRNHVRFVDQDGKPLAGATVEVHQARPNKDEWYGKIYVQQPDITATTDANGWVTLPKNAFGDHIEHTYGHANSVLLYVVTVEARGFLVRTAFQEASDFNLAYWRGQKDDAYYEVSLNLAPDNTRLGQTRILSRP